jgi:hypothetical protein
MPAARACAVANIAKITAIAATMKRKDLVMTLSSPVGGRPVAKIYANWSVYGSFTKLLRLLDALKVKM